MKSLQYTPSATFEDAVALLNENGHGFLTIVNESGKLIGIMTDGDIRRAFLAKETSVLKIMNPNPVTVGTHKTRAEIKSMLRTMHRRHMPVVDEAGRLVEVVVLDDFDVQIKDNWVVVMAGGLGTRLGDLTKETPKPMLPIGGKPILERIILAFKDQGFHRFVICLNYKASLIKDYFGNGDRFGVEICYTEEKEKRGTAGALSLIEKELLSKPFFVINGDVLTKIDYENFLDHFEKSDAMASMVVKQFEEYIPYACVKFDEQTDDMQYLMEKPRYIHYINAGVYLLSPTCLEQIPRDAFFDMPTLFDRLLAQKQKVKVYRINEQWIDIGYPKDYSQANQLYSE